MQLLIATQNPGKKQEFKTLLEHTEYELLFLDDVDLTAFTFPEESGATFQENASIKAKSLADFTGIASVADDSGLSVDALDGFPGVISARWIPGSDQDRIQGLLDKMKNVSDRTARFDCSICLHIPSKNETEFFDGYQIGSIAQQPKGSNGFGYDPVFIPEGQTATYAELGPGYKNKHSHRAMALEKLKSYSKNIMVD
jgi:XTP/dITP diphosphohydrolase